MDDIIDKLKKLKGYGEMDSSPLKEFFPNEEEEKAETENESKESDLEIKSLGKNHQDTAPVQQNNPPTAQKPSDNIPSTGIREFSFDDLEKSADIENESENKNTPTLIETKSLEPKKVKHIRLIVALLDADQYDTAHQEIDKLKDST